MAAEPNRNTEGIRFLDEDPKPVPPPSPPPSASARKRREWPVGLLSFLLVVGVGIAVKWHGEHQGEAKASDEVRMRFKVGPTPRIEVEAPDARIRVTRLHSTQNHAESHTRASLVPGRLCGGRSRCNEGALQTERHGSRVYPTGPCRATSGVGSFPFGGTGDTPPAPLWARPRVNSV